MSYMTVAHLIALLKQFPGETRVMTAALDEFGYDHVTVSGPVDVEFPVVRAILSLDGVPVAQRPAPDIVPCVIIDWVDHGPYRVERIEKLREQRNEREQE